MGSTGVNLREITRRVGCAAPNFYNYFSDLNDLFAELRVRIYDEINMKLFSSINEAKNGKDIFPFLINIIIDFALEHKGWYNFIHFEKLTGDSYKKIAKVEKETEDKITEIIFKLSDNKITLPDAKIIYRIIHYYVIGDISEIITGRSPIEDLKIYKKNLINNFDLLLDSLMKRFINKT